MKTVFIYIVLILWGCPAAVAQQSKQYSFKHFTVSDGLASTSVNRVTQDQDGFVWIGTNNGLQRYDGTRFITFTSRTNDPTSIPDNKVSLLYVDRKNRLWMMGENRKFGIFDTRKFTFSEVPVTGQKATLYIQQGFLELPTGELILLKNDNGILKYDEASNTFVQAEKIIPSPTGWRRTWIHWDARMKAYWMTCDSGLVQYNTKTKNLNYRGHNTDGDPVIESFRDIIAPARVHNDAKGNVVFIRWPLNAAAPVIHKYNRSTSKTELLSTGQQGYHEIGTFLLQRNGRFWVWGKPFFAEWTERNGVNVFNHIPNQYRNEHSLKFDYMHDVYEDRESNIWLASDNGLFIFNPDRQIFNTYYLVRPDGKPAFESVVQAVEQLKDGRIFVGAWGAGGVTCYDNEFNPLPLPPFPAGDNSAWDMAIHPRTSELWIAMQAGSIVIYHPGKNSFSRIFPEVFGGATIRQVDEDTSGNMWFGTHNGKLIKWDYKKSGGDPTKGYELVYQTGLIYKVHYDYQGFIWLGVLEHGLFKLDANTGRVVKKFTSDGKDGERLFNNAPTDMTYYNDSTLLVTAGCVNIINTKTNKITYFTADQGLPSNTALSIEKDEGGIVWVGMLNGICRLNLQKRLITYYDRRDGIIDDKFEKAGVKELRDGRLVFFTDRNMLVFDPRRFGQGFMPGSPRITAFNLAGVPLSLDSLLSAQRAVLHHNNTSISISFSALSHLPQQKMHYYYMLEGLDQDWIRTDKPIEVVYNYLPSGNYTFKVKSENADGIANPQIASLSIKVNPPFWKAWWFISIILLLAVAVLYLLDRERMNRMKSMQTLRRQIRGNLGDEVSTTLNNISVLSEMAKIKADKNVVQAKEYIEQISDKSRHMMEVMDDTLWSIDPQNDSMEHMLLRMKEVTEGMSITNGTDIDLIVDNKVHRLQMDMKMRYDLYFYYKEAIQFMVQHTGAKQLFVNIDLVRSRLMVEILGEHAGEEPRDVAQRFEEVLRKRINALPATTDILEDGKTFSAVLYINLK